MTQAIAALATEDMLAIQQLYGRYNHAIDSGRGDDWAATFTPDGTFASPTGSFAGREELAGFGTAFATRMKARHWNTNIVIEPDGDGAKGLAYLMLLQLKEGAPPTVVATGLYTDKIVKRDGNWLFASRSVATD
jgi:3-phenylpropionate/cinnamic acid dioxygenase small subunit